MGAVYFISDLHLGAPDKASSRVREKTFVDWLDQIKEDAEALYVVGDLFDFWYEYKRAIPRGFTRSLGKLAELADQGVDIHLFTGNHDLWIFDYLPEEIGCRLHRQPIDLELYGRSVLVGHGDGLGPGDNGYKFLKKIFTNRLLQWSFERLHPNFGIWLANSSSRYSRKHTGGKDAKFHGAENEWLFQYCLKENEKKKRDLYLFGHRHLPIRMPLSDKGLYINLGDWIRYFTYLRMDETGAKLLEFKGDVRTDPEAKVFS